jgi:hypothetical protein
MAPVTRSMKRSTRKTVARKTAFNNTYLETTLPPTPTTPTSPAPAPTPTSASAPTSAPTSASDENNSNPMFKTQAEYTAAFEYQFDHPRAALDSAREKKAQREELEVLKARVHNPERSYRFGDQSISDRSSGSDTIIDDDSLIHDLGLKRSEEEYNTYMSRLEHRIIEPLEEAYPLFDNWASESNEATSHWQERWKYTPLQDGRGQKHVQLPVVQLDRSRMTIVGSEKSIIFFDAKNPTKPVLLILRGLVQDEEVLKR